MTPEKPSYKELELRIKELEMNSSSKNPVARELQNIYILSPDLIGSGNLEGYFTAINNSFIRLFGYSKDEFYKNSFFSFIHEDDIEKTKKALIKAINGVQNISVENRYKHKNGSYLWIAWHVLAFANENKFFAIGRDITKQKQMTKAFRESEAKYRFMMESLVDPLYICSSQFKVEYINPSMIKRIGQDASGQYCYSVIHGLDNRCDWCIFDRVQSGETVRTNVKSPLDDKDYQVTNMPIYNQDGTVSKMTIFRDMTDYQIALSEKKEAQAQLLQSEKLASIGQLAAGVAHEINNPVGFVKSNLGTMEEYRKDLTNLLESYANLESELIKTGKINEISSIKNSIQDTKSIKEEIDFDFIMDDYPVLIEDSKEGMERVAKIVADLKDFVHVDNAELEYADINHGIKSSLNIVWNELKYKAEVIKEFGDLPLVKCYPQQLNQIFANLLVNAAHAIDKKGEIRISTRAYNDHVIIKISDTGCGIPQDLIHKVFDPFFTTKEVGKGTGLGLNVVYNIIQTHQGMIDIESEVGKGTTFTITLQIEPDIIDESNT